MKRIGLFLCVFLTVIACGCLTVGASGDGSIVIPYAENAPVIDGVAMDGEYLGEAVVMNDHTAEAWVGDVNSETSTVWNFAWDENGIYVLATVKDSTPSYRSENTNWVGIDCVEIGLNPDYILNQPGDKGVFFSMGATADGRVVVYRHNYDEKIVSAEVQGCATGHVEGSHSYTVEVCIPWSLIFIEADCTKTDTHLDATNLIPEESMIMDMVLATIDADESGTILAAYKIEGTDFVTGKYLPAYLSGKDAVETITFEPPFETDVEPATTSESNLVIISPVDTTSGTENGHSKPSDSIRPDISSETDRVSASSGCGASVNLLWILMLGLAVLSMCSRGKKVKDHA